MILISAALDSFTNIEVRTSRIPVFFIFNDFLIILKLDGEDVPSKLCETCTHELGSAYFFKLKVKSSDACLLLHYNRKAEEEQIQQQFEMEAFEEIDEIEEEIEEQPQKPIILMGSSRSIPKLPITANVATIFANAQISPDKNVLKRKFEQECEEKEDRVKSICLDSGEIFVPQYIFEEQNVEEVIQHEEENSTTELIDSNDIIYRIDSSPNFETILKPSIQLETHKITLEVEAVALGQNHANIYKDLSKVEDNSVMYCCKYCPKAFSTPFHLGLHTKKSHICQFCLMGFPSQKDLHKHVKEHNDFKCSMCVKRTFTNNSNLRAHMRKVHSVVLPPHVSLLEFSKM